MTMNILIVGSGAREHAIAWKLAQSPHQPILYFAPGNPGMETLGQRLNIPVTDMNALRLFALKEKIDLTVVGPEVPLSMGITDLFRQEGLAIFGPTQAAAQLESSKVFSKQFMQKHQIPTAPYVYCQSEAEALEALDDFEAPYVIKEDGLAAGKGVTVAKTLDEAKQAIVTAFKKRMPVVIEGFMTGQELSVLAFCDGNTLLPCIAAQDFKRIGTGNTGANTGGMGAYAPVPLATPQLMQTIQRTILEPTLAGLQADHLLYQGILYFGLMIDDSQTPRVVEYNARFGDPETQVVLPLMEDDLLEVMLATGRQTLNTYQPQGLRFASNQKAVTVVLASQGYPGEYETGKQITFPQVLPEAIMIFHAGTKRMPDQSVVSHGGRVLSVTGTGEGYEQVTQKIYQSIDTIQFEGKTFRTDIAANPTIATATAST
jgi:phosphoribosylamine---glycine ligase